jgi:2-polyprenyl-6-methoxyphenol hydroxylase-like FAD-dependent oxidoreductase
LLADTALNDRFLERGNSVTAANLIKGNERLAHLDMDFPDTHFSSLLGLSQREIEELLEVRLEELGGRLERPVEVASFQLDDDSVFSVVLTHPNGRLPETTVDCPIGCDGAHGVARKSLGIPFEADSFDRWLVQGDVAV